VKPRPPRSPRGPVSAQRLFEGLLKNVGFNPGHFAVFEIWDNLLGREASRARAVGLQGGTLHVEAASPAHVHDLTLRKKTLLKKLNQHFGGRAVISDIMIRLPDARRKTAPDDGRKSAAS
jgi:hypothetical protein